MLFNSNYIFESKHKRGNFKETCETCDDSYYQNVKPFPQLFTILYFSPCLCRTRSPHHRHRAICSKAIRARNIKIARFLSLSLSSRCVRHPALKSKIIFCEKNPELGTLQGEQMQWTELIALPFIDTFSHRPV